MSYWTTAFAGQDVRVSADLELYYDEAGSGRPLIFVTGWTGTNEFLSLTGYLFKSQNTMCWLTTPAAKVDRPRRLRVTTICSMVRICGPSWTR